MTKPDPMNQTQIAELWDCARTGVMRAKPDLGDPVEGAGRGMWPRDRVIAVGRMRGYLDERGRPVPRSKKPPVPYPYPDPESGELRIHAPDAAAMLGLTLNTFHAWVNRGKVAPPDGETGRYPWYHLSTLRRVAKENGKKLDVKVRRPAD